MWLDADDVVEDEDIEKIQKLKKELDKKVSIVMMKYHTAFDEDGNPSFSYYRERMVKREELHLWEGEIHEVIPLTGRLLYTDIGICHRKVHVSDANRNLRIFEAMLDKGKKLNPREQFYYARELYYHKRYKDAVKAFKKFLKEDSGWIENKIDACEMLGYCYYALHKEEKALESFLCSLQYEVPHAELCCDIAKHFMDRAKYKEAIFWYECEMCIRDSHITYIASKGSGGLKALSWMVFQDGSTYDTFPTIGVQLATLGVFLFFCWVASRGLNPLKMCIRDRCRLCQQCRIVTFTAIWQCQRGIYRSRCNKGRLIKTSGWRYAVFR